MKKVCIVNGSSAYKELFKHLMFDIVDSINQADLVCFTGGADVSPDYYGDAKHRTTGNDRRRDENEIDAFHLALSLNKPMIGICRGGQFINVMSGGRMYQDVTGHALHKGHDITDLQTGEVVYVSSTHHQMIMPSPRGLVVASSPIVSSREWYDGQVFKKDVSNEGIEVVWYEHTKSLCFQPHPEFMWVAMVNYFESLLKRYFKKELYA